jgi:hypothetical protein
LITVRIIDDWKDVDFMRQSPGGAGQWGRFTFTRKPFGRCDYTVILNRVPEDTSVICPFEHVWVVFWEPPVPELSRLPSGVEGFTRVYTQDPNLRSTPFVQSHPALPWFVARGYDYLATCPPPTKELGLSWITSNKSLFYGHRRRMRFLNRIYGRIPFDLFGAGFRPIADKWDALAPYRYSIAVENHIGPFYWSEKLADCFLAWTMPIYCGCTNITDYFPAEALVQIDISDKDSAEKIKEAIASDLWQKNRDAIAYARDLVLNR